jgi:acetyl esterase/lipase
VKGNPVPVDPSIAPILQMMNSAPQTDYRAADPELVRTGLRQAAAMAAPRPPIELRSVTDSAVPGPAGDIPVRVYRPTGLPAPAVVYFHGGSWLAGDLDSHDFLLRKLARETGFTYVAVHYRRPPEDVFPAAVDDSTAAALRVAGHPGQFGAVPGRIAVAGDSAGANLAAVVARRLRDQGHELAAQLLLYPVIDPAGDYPSRSQNAEGYLLTSSDVTAITEVYLGGDTSLLASPDLAPIRAGDLSNLAPAVIGVAQYDPLRDEGLAYADALRAAGVDVFARSYQGMIHTFAAMYNISPAADAALKDILAEFSARVTAATALAQTIDEAGPDAPRTA